MSKEPKVTILLTLPKRYRDFLRKLAAGANLENPEKVVSAASLATEYLCRYLDEHLDDTDEILYERSQKDERDNL